jgi:hypothetical protein
MKILLKKIIMLLGSLLLAACAGGIVQLPHKYDLGGQLEQVDKISRYTSLTDWEMVDTQSLIIETGSNTYYLLILKFPAPELISHTGIIISTSGSVVRAGFDEVIVYNGVYLKNSYLIERIFMIKGIEQMRTIRDQLTGEKDTQHKDNNDGKPDKPGLSIDGAIEI